MRLTCVRRFLSPLVLTVVLAACDSGDKGGGDEPGGKADSKNKGNDGGGKDDGAKQADADAGAAKKDEKAKKDRGDASVKMGDVEWTAEIASARIAEGKLKLDLSRMDRADGRTSRDSFTLIVPEYEGPGDYMTQMGSMFVGVGFDHAALGAAEGKEGKADDAKVEKAAVDAIKQAKTLMLYNTKIHIESDADDQIVGTFEKADGKPPLTDGKFRALVKKRT